jgi:hypothetical protein
VDRGSGITAQSLFGIWGFIKMTVKEIFNFSTGEDMRQYVSGDKQRDRKKEKKRMHQFLATLWSLWGSFFFFLQC